MTSRRNVVLFLAAVLLIAASLACGAGATAVPRPAPGALPTSVVATRAEGIITAPTATPMAEEVTPPAPAIPERRRVTLEYPPRIRSGDSDIVRLTLEVDELGNLTPTAVTEGNQVTGGTVEIPNLYETHHVTAEARLDMAGVEIRPPEMVSEPLAPGQAVTFYWSVKPEGKGTFKGTAWLFLKFVDKKTGEASERAISAQVIEIQSTEFLGLSAGVARTTGAVGSVVGGIIGFPFLEDIVKFLLRKVRR